MSSVRRYLPELGRALLGVVYVGGAAVHLFFWATNRALYGELTQYVLFEWYRDLWTDVVLPHLGVLLPTLAAFELLVGVAILLDDRVVKAGLTAGALFNLALTPLGFWWPSNVALALGHVALLRYEYPRSSFGSLRARLGRRTGVR